MEKNPLQRNKKGHNQKNKWKDTVQESKENGDFNNKERMFFIPFMKRCGYFRYL